MRNNQLNEIRAIKIKNADENNTIKLTDKSFVNSKILVNDSELLRIIKHFQEPDTLGKYPYIDDIVSVKVNKSIKKLEQVKDNNGVIKIDNCEFEKFESDDKAKLKTIATKEFKRLITASGHTRSKKSMFINSELFEKVDDILMCGIPKEQQYAKLSKWNSYYGLCATDSKAVSMPNIVVIDDFKNPVEDTFDIVKQTADKKGLYHYSVEPNVKKEYSIMPFDGAGLCSVELATIWKEELKLDYIPAAFQFRAIPCVKGNVYTFDIKDFSEKYGDTIIDIKGIPHSLAEEKINCILTKSQFKFSELYPTIEDWVEKFNTPCHDYHRTFNISEYSEKYEDLKHNMLTAYQPMQTINFTDDEIVKVCDPTVNMIRKISTDVNEFLKFRGLTDDNDDDTQIDWSVVPPCYKALKDNKLLFGDKYIQDKIKEDIKNVINRALTAKLFVRGNYQVLTPDIYGLAQWAFGIKPTGLVNANQIYSNYWNNQKVDRNNIREVDIVRNPHIAFEHRVVTVNWSDDMKYWFKYQDTGIITSMYDTILLALNSADADGDHIATIFDSSIISAVKRMNEEGKSNTIDFVQFKEVDDTNSEEIEKDVPKVNDIKALIDVDILGMSNDIGQVIDRVSELWSLEQTDEIQDYIKIMSIIASLTIDYAKTGEKAEIPREIKVALKGVKKPYFMKYLPSQANNKSKEDKAIDTANKLRKNNSIIEKQKVFSRTHCNVNRICWYLEKAISDVEFEMPKEVFDTTMLINENVDIYGDLYKNIKKKLRKLHDIFSDYTKEYKIENANSKDQRKDIMNHYRSFYEFARYELLSLCKLKDKRVDKVLDILLALYYSDAYFINKDKSILWNAFDKEMIARCAGTELTKKSVDNKDVLKRKHKAEIKVHAASKEISKRKEVDLKIFADNSNVFVITEGDLKQIYKRIKRKNKIGENNIDIKDVLSTRKLFLVFLILSRKSEESKTHKVALRDKDGKLVKDDDSKKIMVEEVYQKQNPIQILDGGKQCINYSNLAKLADIDRRKVIDIMNQLEDLGLIKTSDNNLSKPKVKVMFGSNAGDVLYEGNELLEATKLVKRFR